MSITIKKSIVVEAPAETVWQAITDPRKLSQWYMATVDFKPEIGSKFEFQDTPQGKWDGKILGEITAVEPPHLLEYTFWGNQMTYTTTVRWQLTPEGSGTRVTVDHSGFEGFGGLLMSMIIRFGWRKFLKRLVTAVA